MMSVYVPRVVYTKIMYSEITSAYQNDQSMYEIGIGHLNLDSHIS
jgi:hypothetical protein